MFGRPGSADAAWAWLNKHKGAGYDYLGLLGFVARAIGHDTSRFVCSEAVAEMLGMSNGWRFDPCSLHAALVWRETSAVAAAASNHVN